MYTFKLNLTVIRDKKNRRNNRLDKEAEQSTECGYFQGVA